MTHPGQIIGYRRNGAPIRLVRGASQTAVETAPAAQQDGQQQGTPAPAAPAPQGAPAPTGQPAEVQDGDKAADLAARYSPADLAALALRYRSEAASGRVTARQNAAEQARTELLDTLKPSLVALGVIPADAEPDVAQITSQLEQSRTQNAAAQLELAMLRAALPGAPADGVRVDLLTDSRAFLATVSALDPTDPEFGGKVASAMTAAADKDPQRFRVTQAGPKRGGVPMAGGSGEQVTKPDPSTSLADALAQVFNPTL